MLNIPFRSNISKRTARLSVPTRAEKSRSTVNSPIFACRSRIVVSCSDGRDPLPLAKISSNPSTACRFHVVTWFGWTSCRAAISCTVRSPRNASSTTRFLKAAVNRRRRLVVIPVPPQGSGIHLSRLSEKAGLCGVLDYAELTRRPAWPWAIWWSGTPHSQRASRKSRRWSVAVKRRGCGAGSSTHRSAASFMARSAST